MFRARALFMLATVAATVAAMGTACNRYAQGSSAGAIDPADAAATVVLRVKNQSNSPMELRTILNGRSQFVASVGGNDSSSVLLDPGLFPTGFLYVTAIPSDGRGRAVVGPLSASKGDKIELTIEAALETSHAIVVR